MLIYMRSRRGEDYPAFSSDVLPRPGDVLHMVHDREGKKEDFRVLDDPARWSIQDSPIGEMTARMATITVERDLPPR